MTDAGRIGIGVGGWVFEPWRGTFYPDGLSQKDELNHMSRRVTAIEINATYYGSQKPTTFDTPLRLLAAAVRRGPRSPRISAR